MTQQRVTGRQRIHVDYALILHLGEDCCLGWIRMTEEYRRIKGEFVSLETMIHGHREETYRDIAKQVSAEYNLYDYITIFSSVELQKVRVKYQV